MKEAEIDRAGCFAYSPVNGAAANDIPGMLPPELREERRARFMAVAEAVSARKAAKTHWRQPCKCWWIRRRAWAKKVVWAEVMPMRRRLTARCALAAREDQQNPEGG
jgi:hypothetical protein